MWGIKAPSFTQGGVCMWLLFSFLQQSKHRPVTLPTDSESAVGANGCLSTVDGWMDHIYLTYRCVITVSLSLLILFSLLQCLNWKNETEPKNTKIICCGSQTSSSRRRSDSSLCVFIASHALVAIPNWIAPCGVLLFSTKTQLNDLYCTANTKFLFLCSSQQRSSRENLEWSQGYTRFSASFRPLMWPWAVVIQLWGYKGQKRIL